MIILDGPLNWLQTHWHSSPLPSHHVPWTTISLSLWTVDEEEEALPWNSNQSYLGQMKMDYIFVPINSDLICHPLPKSVPVVSCSTSVPSLNTSSIISHGLGVHHIITSTMERVTIGYCNHSFRNTGRETGTGRDNTALGRILRSANKTAIWQRIPNEYKWCNQWRGKRSSPSLNCIYLSCTNCVTHYSKPIPKALLLDKICICLLYDLESIFTEYDSI